MGRCDRRCLAIGIKRSLSKIDKMMLREAMKIEVDALMYEFARLHGIGVIPDEISNSITSYTFLNDPESRIDTGFCMKLVFANHCVNVNWDTVDSSYLERALKQVTIYLNLRYWEEYLEPDCVIPPIRLPWDPLHPEKTRHDDSLDAMRYMIPVIPKLGVAVNNGPTPKEEIDKMPATSNAEQYTGENPKEISDCGININTALAAFVEDVGCLEALYDVERSVYYVRNKNSFVKPPYTLKVNSPIEEISPTALTQLKLDICKYFDI